MAWFYCDDIRERSSRNRILECLVKADNEDDLTAKLAALEDYRFRLDNFVKMIDEEDWGVIWEVVSNIEFGKPYFTKPIKDVYIWP